MSNFGVTEVLRHNNGTEIIELVKSFSFDGDEAHKILSQWRVIDKIQWENKSDTTAFWIEVHKYRDAASLQPFRELRKLAMSLLLLPHSNADVERVFSIMSTVRTKLRNKMCNDTLNAISVRNYLKQHGNACYSYPLPPGDRHILGVFLYK